MKEAVSFLMFQGEANAALSLWKGAFPTLEVLVHQNYPEGTPQAGQVQMARIRLGGSEWRLYDSPPVHAFTFTPSTSIFVDCEDEEELKRIAAVLGEGGAVMMPVGNYGFSKLFTWVTDKYGVSWQLNLP